MVRKLLFMPKFPISNRNSTRNPGQVGTQSRCATSTLELQESSSRACRVLRGPQAQARQVPSRARGVSSNPPRPLTAARRRGCMRSSTLQCSGSFVVFTMIRVAITYGAAAVLLAAVVASAQSLQPETAGACASLYSQHARLLMKLP